MVNFGPQKGGWSLKVFRGLPSDWGRVTMFDNLWHRGLWPSLPRPVNFTRSGAAEAEQGGGRGKITEYPFREEVKANLL